MSTTSNASSASLRERLLASGAEVLTPDTPGYEESIRRWSDTCTKRAAAVAQVRSAEDISAIIRIAREEKIPFVVHGGGHATSGSSSVEDGIVIDLRKMRKVSVDPEAKTITAEGGCIWADVDSEAAKHGLATVGGTVNHTGVGGLTLGGGFGWLTGQYGLTIDNLISVKMVLANGSHVTASETENPDLFWAIRGAGQNFGVSTEFVFRAYEQGPVYAGIVVFTPDKIPQIVEFANHFHGVCDGRQAFVFGFQAPPPGNQPIVIAGVFFNGLESEAEAFYQPLFDVGPVMKNTGMMPYENLNGMLNEGMEHGGRRIQGGANFVTPLEVKKVQDVFEEYTTFVQGHESVNKSAVLFELISFTMVVEISNKAMAYANRGEYYNFGILVQWEDEKLDQDCREFCQSLAKKVKAEAGAKNAEGVGVYSNYQSLPSRAEEIYGINTKRLQALKAKYDPENLFWKWHNLLPQSA